MKPYLLDTNVLIALAWPNHVHHGQSLDWFKEKAAKGFCTCPITQTGFIRISSHPSFTASAPSPMAAFAVLKEITNLPGHKFLADDLSAAEAFEEDCLLASHRQVTDRYLLALAVAHDGVLATLDRGIAGMGRNYPDAFEVIP